MVDQRLIYSDAELARAMRHFAKQLFSLQAERESLLRELRPLWEAQISGALGRLLDLAERLHTAEVGGWRDQRHFSASLPHESDLQLLRALTAVSEKDQPAAWVSEIT
jgi:hypothetical protein